MIKLAQYVNSVISPAEAYELSFGHLPPSGKCFCPFHDNTHTPAAKVYSYGLRCFGVCDRNYTSYDILKKFRPDVIRTLQREAVNSPSAFNPQPAFSKNPQPAFSKNPQPAFSKNPQPELEFILSYFS